MLSRRTLLTAMGLAIFASALIAPIRDSFAAATAGQFVTELGNKAIQLLSLKNISEGERVKRMRKLLDDGFDGPAISKFVLGVYWRRTTAKQRTEFLDLYQTIVAHTYASLFKKFSGNTFKVVRERPDSATSVVVYGHITQPNGQPVPVEFRVNRNSSEFRATDIKVAGVSMPLTHRKDYSSVIRRQRGSIEGLLKVMRKKVALLEERAPSR